MPDVRMQDSGMQDSETYRRNRSYAVRSSRISNAQKKAYRDLAPQWLISFDVNEDVNEIGFHKIDFHEIFPSARKNIVEIGFGMGKATRDMAVAHPHWGILGIEVHRPGIGKLLWWINQDKLENIRIIEADAFHVVSNLLKPESVDAFHIWFPDPWPKKRHHKRRLIQADFLEKVAECLKVGAYIHLATDWESYALHIMEMLSKTPKMKNRNPRWAEKPAYRPNTKFENLGIKNNRVIRDIIFERII